MFNRKVIRRQEPAPPPQSFSFNFDDSAQPQSAPPATGSQKIHSLLGNLEPHNNTHNIPLSGIKLKDPNANASKSTSTPTQTDNSESTSQSASQSADNNEISREITLYHPSLLHTPTPIYQSHIVPKSSPGVHIIYAPIPPLPTSRKAMKKKVAPKLPPSKTLQKPPPTDHPPTPTDSLPLYPTPVANFIPKWVCAVDVLDPDDFECSLSSLPDIMLDPESYLLSLPNPTDRARNIFVSISAPLRCVTAEGQVLESAYCMRKFNPRDDDYLLSTSTRSTNNIGAVNQKHKNNPAPSQSKTKSTIANPTHAESQQPWYEQQVLWPESEHPESVLVEVTTFAVVVPPKCIIDVCHVITTAHTHTPLSTTQNILNFISTREFQSESELQAQVDDQLNLQTQANQPPPSLQSKQTTAPPFPIQNLRNILHQPLHCPTLLQDMCRDNLPLDLAQRYISNHISAQPPSYTTQSVGPVLPNAPQSPQTPQNSTSHPFIPLLSFPLPLPSTYLFTQTAAGAMTHHSAQTRYAIDIGCVEQTPVLAPCDGVISEIEAKSCSSGHHVTNLFDWNSVTIKTRITEAFVNFPTATTATTATTSENATQETKRTITLPPSPHTSLSQYNLLATDTDGLCGSMYVDLVHLAQIDVKKGQMIKKGEILGYTGSTGFSPSPHLHLQCSLSPDPTAHTIPFAFKYESANGPQPATSAQSPHQASSNNVSSRVGASEPIATLGEAGWAFNGQNVVNLDQFYHLSHYTKSYYTSLSSPSNYAPFREESLHGEAKCCFCLGNQTVLSTLPNIDGSSAPSVTPATQQRTSAQDFELANTIATFARNDLPMLSSAPKPSTTSVKQPAKGKSRK